VSQDSVAQAEPLLGIHHSIQPSPHLNWLSPTEEYQALASLDDTDDNTSSNGSILLKEIPDAENWDYKYPTIDTDPDINEKATPPILKRENPILCIVGLNTISTCFLVVLNKYIFSFPRLQSLQFSFTAWHVFCTFSILFIASLYPFRLFDRIYLDVSTVLPLSAAFTIWIILNNLSLALNPLGFYQIAKILTTPTVVVLNYFIAGITVSKIVVGALGAICIGVAMTRQGSTETTLLGVLVATAAFITTAIYQTWIGTKQERVNSAQLLFNQSYLSLGMLTIIILIPFTDRQQLAAATIGTDDGEKLDVRVWVAIGLSGVTAMAVNLTQFLIIGKTSAVTVSV